MVELSSLTFVISLLTHNLTKNNTQTLSFPNFTKTEPLFLPNCCINGSTIRKSDQQPWLKNIVAGWGDRKKWKLTMCVLIHGAIAYSSSSLHSLRLLLSPMRKFTTTSLLYVSFFLNLFYGDFESNTDTPLYSNRFKRHKWRGYAEPMKLLQWMANIQDQHLKYETAILLLSKLRTARVTMSPSTGNHIFSIADSFYMKYV